MKKALWIIPFGIVLLVIFLFISYYLFPSQTAKLKELASYLSGMSTVGILVLTAIYVFFTNLQISELQKQRQLQVQPLPNIKIKEGEIQRPRLVMDPTKGGNLSLIVDFLFPLTVKNVGNGAAVFVDLFAVFIGRKISNTLKTNIDADRLNIIEQGQEKQWQGRIRDNSFEAIRALNSSPQVPCSGTHLDVLIRFSALYRNVLGSAFRLNTDYMIGIDQADKNKLAEWIAAIDSFATVFSTEIALQKSLIQRDRDEASKVFDSIKSEINKRLPDEKIAVRLRDISSSFALKQIEQNELFKIEKELVFGFPVHTGRDKDSNPDPNVKSVN